MPLSFYDYRASQAVGYSYHGKYFGIGLQAIRTFTLKQNKTDFSASFTSKAIFLRNGNRFPFQSGHVGLNVGSGFSSNLSQWAIRPEIGYHFKPADERGVFNLGVALQVLLPSHKK